MTEPRTTPGAGAETRRADPLTVAVEASGAEWDAFLEAHPDATAEHLWGWRDVYARAFGHDCVYLSARREGRIVGILPLVRYRSAIFGRFLVSLPYFNYAGVVAEDGAAVRALVAHATELVRVHRGRHLELRHRDPQMPELPHRQEKIGFSRPLPATSDALWTSIDRKVRNQVRKAQKENLVVADGSVDLVDDFYGVFARNMRDLGTPVFPRALFSEAARIFPDRTRVFVVRHQGKPVAGGVAVLFRDTVLVPWASSLREARHLCPNMLLYWAMMEWAVARGARVFDFGRSSIGAGTQQFKEQWGGVGRPLTTEYVLLDGATLPNQGTTNSKMQLAIKVWKQLPVGLSTALGPRVMTHLA